MRWLWRLILIMAACPAAAQDAAEVAVARAILTELQPLSFAKKREYCGYIGYNAQAVLVASTPIAGNSANCEAPFPDDLAVVASYHTHGAFDRGYVNELPSDIDINSDAYFLLNGYVATPGGRLWFIDGRGRTLRQICGVGCLPVAPRFYKGSDGDIAEAYTFEELIDRLTN